jgi:Glycosyltransferase Family 4
MRRVLIVSPSFPPKSTADLHRVRTALAHYRSFGWIPTVLCIAADSCEGLDDPELVESLPADVQVVRVKAWDETRCRRFGFGHLAYRCLLPLYRAGSRALARDRHNVVFFSSTVFLTFALGPVWKRRFGCRIVYDFHDPWYKPPSAGRDMTVGWKYRLDQVLARYLEPLAVKGADHIISVSPGYVRDFQRRYPWINPATLTVLPFGVSAGDYAFLQKHGIAQSIFTPDPDLRHWVYGGAVAANMLPVLEALLQALADLKELDPQLANGLRLHFVGTDYAPAGRSTKRVEPIAQRLGLQGMVLEHPQRLPYFETLSLYEQSDAVLLIGSSSPDYTSSKLFNCIMAKRPILALFHRQSLVAEIARAFPNVFLATFEDTPAEPQFRAQVRKGIEWLRAPRFDRSSIDQKLKPWSAEELTRRQCAIFDQVCASIVQSSGQLAPSDARS